MKFILPCLLVFKLAAAPVLRLVEDTLPAAAAHSLVQHQLDLEAEGWTVTTVFVPSQERKAPFTNHINIAQDTVWPFVRANPGGAVILIGNVPMPASGINYSVTEMPIDWGALPAPCYYALPDVEWTDTQNNTNWNPGGKPLPAIRLNNPGDGRFDNQSLGAALPLASVGVINFSFANPTRWGSAKDAIRFHIQCYNDYFTRLHDYRSGKWTIKTKGAFGHWRNGGAGAEFEPWAIANLGGVSAFRPTNSSAFPEYASFLFVQDFKLLPYTEAFWSTVNPRWAFFDTSFGSGQATMDAQRVHNAFNRSLLSATWARRWDLTPLLSGQTIGDCWKAGLVRGRDTTFGLNGDPTLRLNINDRN